MRFEKKKLIKNSKQKKLQPCADTRMSVSLSKAELHQVSAITGAHSLAVLPVSSKGKTQKVLVGDSSGEVTCFSMKKGAAKIAWKTRVTASSSSESNGSLPSSSSRSSSDASFAKNRGMQNQDSIGGLCLSGSKGDKCFVSQRSTILGINRKGKIFFEAQTNLVDDIDAFSVRDTFVWIGARSLYTVLDDGKEKECMMLPGNVSAILVVKSGFRSRAGSGKWKTLVIIGCSDRTIRFVVGSRIVETLPVQSVVSSLELISSKEGETSFVYGTIDGSLCLVKCSLSASVKRNHIFFA